MATPSDTILVTGANSGIGFEIARQLAARGASVIMACRDAEAGEEAAERIRYEFEDAVVELRQVDLSSPVSIRAFAHRLTRDGRTLDVLVNNAGIHASAWRPSPAGLESTFATNVLGYHVATREFLPLLEAGAAARGGRRARIVNVASTYVQAPDLDDPQFRARPFDGSSAYKESKAADRMLTRAWARRLAERGVDVNSMAPGLVMTRIFRETGLFTGLMVRLAHLLRGRTVSQGADTAVWLAADAQTEGFTGGFFRQRQRTECEFTNPEREERLFALCEELAEAGSGAHD